jgi:hypothetical protein
VATPEGSYGLVPALAKLGELLADSGGRQSFAEDAEKAARDAGVDWEVIPQPARDALTELSLNELATLNNVNQALRESGMYINFPGDVTLSFF